MKYAEILFQQKVGSTQETLTYKIPQGFNIQIGQAVEVSIRRKRTSGIVWQIHQNKPAFKTLEISKIHYQAPILSPSQIHLINWMSEYYLSDKYKVLKLFIPARVLNNKPFRRTKKEEKEHKIRSKELILSKDQEAALKKITESSSNKYLIQGVTGSGKTEVYTRIAKQALKQNQQALILVPEISLTPQTIEYFEKSLGSKAAVIHSKLSPGERYHNWMNIWKNEVKLIIGSRSSLLGPFQDLHCIIIDEEHENSYKQEQSPRYQVHQVLEQMQKIDPKLKVIYGSATPSIETTERLKEHTINLTERIGDATLPNIEIVDLREEFKKKNFSIFSDKLHQALKKNLDEKKQSILFLNRRGSASSIVCRDCGYTSKCPECDISMTFHARTLQTPQLICHHCGKIESPPPQCPSCTGHNIRQLGIGTQKIETEVKKLFPEAKTLRADKDTTSNKQGFEKIYQDFRNHKADILIGTQMIAKGLHLPKVSLVGVVISDIGLNIPDFRSSERIFQLMTQVAGRAGRSAEKGKVIIQTYNPENNIFEFIKNQNYESFFNFEREQRKVMANPPFSKLCKIIVEAKTLKEAEINSKNLEEALKKENISLGNQNLQINSYPAYITKLRNKYRYIILIKDSSPTAQIHKLLEKIPKEAIIKPEIKIDIDPISVT